MNKNKVTRWELLLLSIPVLFLVTIAVIFQRPQPNRATQIFIDEVKITELPIKNGGFGQARVSLSVNYQGTQPGWWGSPVVFWLQNTTFVTNDRVLILDMGHAVDGYHNASHKYFIRCSGIVLGHSKVPGKGTFKGTVVIKQFKPDQDLGVVRFSIPIFEALQ